MDISIITVTYNTSDLVARNLSTLLANLPTKPSCEVIMVDNASIDGTPRLIDERFPQIRLLKQERNLGFGAGCNRGLEVATGKVVFFVNPDIIIAKNSIELLYNYLMANSQVGVVSPWLIFGGGKPNYAARRFHTKQILVFHTSSPLRKVFPRAAKRYIHLLSPPKGGVEVDWVAGAAMMVRRNLLNELGGFDEEYFMYMEDSDLCWRAKRLGYATHLLGTVTLIHLHQCSTSLVPYKMALAHHRSLFRFLRKRGDINTIDELWMTPILWLNILFSWGFQLIKYRLLP